MKRTGFVILAVAVAVLCAAGAQAGGETSVGGSPSTPGRMAALGVGTPGIEASSVYNGTVAFTCTDATALGTGSHVLDRDNTGTGREQLRVDVTDGSGRLLVTLTYDNALGTYGGGIGSFTYTSQPFFNPLTFTLTSLAGNGLPEQVDYVQQGSCQGLATFTEAVPTVSGVGLVVLVGLLASAAIFVLRRVSPV